MNTTERADLSPADTADWPVDAAFEAAEAIAHALPPGDLGVIGARQLRTPWFMAVPTADLTEEEHCTQVLAEALLDLNGRPDGHAVWWAASGENVTAALCVVTGLDEASASMIVGCAAIARDLAGRDRGDDGVLRLAERAACWRKGAAAADPS